MSFPSTPNRSSDPALWEARAALQAGDMQRAVALYQTALGRNPNSGEAHHALGRLLLQARRYEQARNHLTRAAAIEPNNPEFLRSLAEVLTIYRDHIGALAAFEKIRRLTPGVPDAHMDAAALHDALGDREKARAGVVEALALDPHNPRALTLHIKLAMGAPDKPDAPKMNEFRATLERIAGATPDETTRALAYHLLGQINDRLGDCDAAFTAYTNLNRTDRASPFAPRNEHREGYLRAIDEMAQAITPQRAARWAEQRVDDGLPAPTLLVGFPGSGTTLLERALGAHPRLIALDEKATIDQAKAMLFRLPGRRPGLALPDYIDALTPEQVGALRREYWRAVDQLTGPREPGTLVFDKMPVRIIDLPFVNRIFPEARVIVALRDPRDACLSCFIKRFNANIPMSFFLDLHDTARLYQHVMGAWLRSRDAYTLHWMESKYEDVVADFPARAADVLAFLALEWDEGVVSYHDRTAGETHKATTGTFNFTAVRRGIDSSSVGRWTRYERHLAPILPTLQPFVEAFGYASA